MGRINIQLEQEAHKKLKILCALKETTIEKYINKILKERLKKDVK